ncbi:guard protein for 5'-capping of pre-mRNAs Srp2/Npl3 [Schizosaccharomyces pombe]|uniref:Pre-mRNA-splicing factor srp2 n=1 Tax=Schizosaccharomyces pombe (strain 972 / ATCC 24843) TaxID=284812 RepID=SRP2_SCHPO|nr:mRNA export factor Srp2 [Schizosaccharomyces pombe]P78814.2 RecName: Full=Pre-mRNA-splicing factor srp2 [Schizosaccharomyces pombe 972h-]AAC39357.1 putative pre-mRNA splicing factor [Schizosaccharomyces pombe]CAB57400.1 mRNA export factor Srp2 [Schizosaccharomyces pombe]|eukprot:NP_594570.1 mRNA export factor Srp2 [Schizosaccharomyces pombe]
MSETRLFVGRIPPQATREDMMDFFKGYGQILDCKLMNGFGFVEVEDARDARDIVNDFQGKEFMGSRIVVEPARGERRRRENFRESAASKYPRPRRTGFRLIVENLSEDVSWQDLKDVMRKAGEPTFTDAHRENPGAGVVEFSTEEDMRNALTSLNGEVIKGQAVTLREDPDAANEPLPEVPSRFRSRSPPARRRYRDDYRRGGDYRRDAYRPGRDDERRYAPRGEYRRNNRDEYRRGGRDEYRRNSRSDYRRPHDDEYRRPRGDEYRPGRDEYRRSRDDGRPSHDDEYRRDAYSRSPSPRRDREENRSPAYEGSKSYSAAPEASMESSAPTESYDKPAASEEQQPLQNHSDVGNGSAEGQVAAEW